MKPRVRLAILTRSESRIIYGPIHDFVNGLTACGLRLPSAKIAVPSDPWWTEGPRCGDCASQ